MNFKIIIFSITLLITIAYMAGCDQNTPPPAEKESQDHSSISEFAPATGWVKGGNDPNSYDMGIDKGAGQNGNAATIRSTAKHIDGFATLTQEFLPDNYKGKRIRMSGHLKARNVDNWASLWMRVDEENAEERPFNTMADQVIKGSSGWKKYDIVLDVPAKATNIAFGALLNGTGQIWIDDIGFEVVNDSVPVTSRGASYKRGKEPVNLTFEE